ncbi:MAG: aromatic-ring-hydroxylating dioxygenase subunit beta [Alphaproteobacteria bacterium]|nr:aromatic-ring-hydroxylating dioxygenase subunit beta [Alphaproteobacteria bacterium]
MATRAKIDVETRLAVEDFLYAYADCLDHGDIEDWADFFTDDCTYTLISKENYDLGLPLGTIFAEKKGGILDRITSVTKTTVYHQRELTHMITNTRVLKDAGDTLEITANYAVLETLPNQYTKILNSGRYLGTLTRDKTGPAGLRIKKLDCIFDSALVPASIIYPI